MKFFLFVLCIIISPLYAAESLVDPLIYLTWTHDPCSSMTVQWISSTEETETTLLYQKDGEAAGNNGWKIAYGSCLPLPENQPYFLHRVELQNLQPNQKYQCIVMTRAPQTLSFRTMPQSLDTPVRFAVGGDACDKSIKAFRKMNQRVAKTNPRFAILGGDIAYAVKKRSPREDCAKWLQFFRYWMLDMKDDEGCTIPLLVTIGNHEVKRSFYARPEAATFFYLFFERARYTCDMGDYAQFIFLDSDHTQPVSGLQTNWLHTVLKGSMHFLHRFAIYHVGAYPSTANVDGYVSGRIKKHWVPLFERYRLHACFESHNHAYKRTHPLLGNKRHKKGVTYFGDGSWGVEPRKSTIHKKHKHYFAHTEKKQQVLIVELSKKERTFWALDVQGTTFDFLVQTVK